ncbi:MAG: LON peptidase substrate-binding domain-containing protein, partial [Gammaproteobacteria bacterium]
MSTPSDDSSNTQFPLLPLRDVVVYPQIVQPLFVGRPKSIKALEIAMASNKQVLLVAQKNASDDEPAADDLYQIGTVATILQLIRLPDGTVKVLVEGLDRAQLRNVSVDADHFRAEILVFNADAVPEKESALLIRSLLSQFEQYVQL